MARIKYSGLVDSINGSINGTTFQRNRYGSTVKGKPQMVRPTTLFQQQQKQLMTRVTQLWRTLSEMDRQDWNAYAEANPVPSRLNPDAYLNGFNLFQAYHRYRGLTSNAVLSSPSLVLEDIGTFGIDILNADPTLNLAYSNQDFTGSWINIFFLTGVIPFGREFVNTTPRYIANGNFDNDNTLDITEAYNNKIGSIPPAGQFIGIKLVRICTTTAQFTVTSPFQEEVIE